MEENHSHFTIAPVIGILLSVACGLAAIFVVLPCMSEEQAPICESLNPVIHSTEQIYSVEDGVSLHGEFFLGMGSVNTYPAYYYYAGNDNDGFVRQMISSEFHNIVIFRDSDTPYITKLTKYKMVPISPGGGRLCTPMKIIEIHIPKDTLIKQI